jgi:hypothetical protein
MRARRPDEIKSDNQISLTNGPDLKQLYEMLDLLKPYL